MAAARPIAVLVCTLLAVCAAIVAVDKLQDSATGGRDAELTLVELRLDLAQIQQVPWGASPEEGDDPQAVRDELQGMEQEINAALADLERERGLPERDQIVRPLQRTMGALHEILELVAQGRGDDTGDASSLAAHQAAIADQALQRAAKRYRSDSVGLLDQSRNGSAAVILLLFAAFAWFYRRSSKARRRAEALAGENRRLADASREEAVTDALTGLGNRRGLIADLEVARPAHEGEQVLLALFDLDGFKQYNDTFGHPAGDALLARLGVRLAQTMQGVGAAYRMGGDEFCIVASASEDAAEAIAGLAAAALSEAGVGFAIGCSYGTALIPRDASSADDALLAADQRMYQNKQSGRIPPSRQSANVLVRLLGERDGELARHNHEVAQLAEATATGLGLAKDEIEHIRLAAELHDVGKAAVPDAILNKPGSLDEAEWKFVRRHPLIAERIIGAAPSLARSADFVRSHHERLDGSGYPDGLSGEAIPRGARIIGVCDAFASLTSDRPYRSAVSADEALAEIRRCAGTQFDPVVVEAFAAVLAPVN